MAKYCKIGHTYLNMQKYLNLKATIVLGFIFAFLTNTLGPMPWAQADDFILPKPGVMVNLSPAFNPPILKGIKVHSDDPFRFDFILDVGDGSKPSFNGRVWNPPLQEESIKLIKYFLASLTIPDKDLWVNLSPYEKDRIIPQSFGLTEMGRDLLAEDYMLKQITASLIYPEEQTGKKFWKRIYEEAAQKFGTTNIPVNTFNKVWIVPEKAVVYENAMAGTAYVVEAKLKVMLEEDYLSLGHHSKSDAHRMASEVIRQIVIPELTKEVNEGRNFAQLRQVYNSLILAAWYKTKIKDSVLAQIYEDKNKISGVNIKDPQEKEKIYQQYLRAFKKGVFNYIKEEIDVLSQQTIPKKYFSGGFGFNLINAAMTVNSDAKLLTGLNVDRSMEVEAKIDAVEPVQMATAQNQFIADVILPVMGREELPPNLNVKLLPNGDITLQHVETEPLSGTQVDFRYKIRFTHEKVVRVPKFVDLNKENVLDIPLPTAFPWEDEAIETYRYALRRLLIADPLNGRFSGQYQLDPYQMEAIENNMTHFHEGHTKALDIMATATGKTVVAFNTLDRYMDELKAKGQGDGSVLFLVNNNTILNEAEDKLHKMYPGKYSTSKVYEGEANYDGKVIFATPRSLASGNRIEELLKAKTISMVIIDETHHLPAREINKVFRRIEEESIRNKDNGKPETIFLGLTATESRPDRRSVVGMFLGNIVFEYMIQEGQREGALVPYTYINGDKGYPSTSKEAILPGDDLWPVYRDWRYSEQRYPDLLEAYEKYAQELIDKRALIIAPDVASAQKLSAYFRQHGVSSVSLTAKDRQEDPDAFDANYIAWKNGKWQDPQKTKPVPQVVIAVDIFKEGVDVPAINLVMLWNDTNSSIEFVQSIGRGLRLAPFKSRLIILDMVGLYRKLSLLRYLQPDEVPGTRGTRPEILISDVDDDTPRPIYPVSVESDINSFSENVTEMLDDFFENLPSKLVMRHNAYEEVTPMEKIRLFDPWLAIKTGFVSREAAHKEIKEGVKNFYHFVSGFAQQLYERTATVEQKREFRHKFLMALHAGTVSDIEDALTTPIDPGISESIYVYYRILELLNLGRSQEQVLSPELLDDVFPEFSEREKFKAANRSANLKILRKIVFKTDIEGLAREMYTSIINDPKQEVFRDLQAKMKEPQKYPNAANTNLWAQFYERDGKQGNFEEIKNDIENAEGKKERSEIAGKKEKAFVGFLQSSIIDLLLYHPKLKNILTQADFDLSSDEFLKKLEQLQMSSSLVSFQDHQQLLVKNAREYLDLQKWDRKERYLIAKNNLLLLLRNKEYEPFFTYENVSPNMAQELISIHKQLVRQIDALDSQADGEDKEIEQRLRARLESAKIYDQLDIEGFEGVKFLIVNSKSEVSITIQTSNKDFSIPPGPPMVLNYQQDSLGTPYILFNNGMPLSQIEQFYQSLTSVDRLGVMNTIIELISRLSGVLTESPVLMIPQGSVHNALFTDLFNHVKVFTELDVLGPFREISDSRMFKFTLKELNASRLSRLTPDYILRSSEEKKSSYAFNGKIDSVLDLLYRYRNQVLPRWGMIKNKLFQTVLMDPEEQKMRLEIVRILKNQTDSDFTDAKKMGAVNRIFNLVDVQELRPLTREELMRVAFYTLFEFRNINLENEISTANIVKLRTFVSNSEEFELNLIKHKSDLSIELADEVKEIQIKIDDIINGFMIKILASQPQGGLTPDERGQLSSYEQNHSKWDPFMLKSWNYELQKLIPRIYRTLNISAEEFEAMNKLNKKIEDFRRILNTLRPSNTDALKAEEPKVAATPVVGDASGVLKQAYFAKNGDQWDMVLAIAHDVQVGHQKVVRAGDWNIPRALKAWGKDNVALVFASNIAKRELVTIEDTPLKEQWPSLAAIRNSAEDGQAGHDLSLDEDGYPKFDQAQISANGGIDFTANKMPLEIQNAGAGIKVHLNAAMLHQLQNAPGFVPIIINVKPLTDLKSFLGLKEAV